jgi:PKHD-type hydroxylase
MPPKVTNEENVKEYVVDENGNKIGVTNVTSIQMNPGDAVVYKGIEKIHWRNKYNEGRWQAQVFLHYVDANGPYSSEKYDGRKSLSHQGTDAEPIDMTYWHSDDIIPLNACQSLISSTEQYESEKAGVGAYSPSGSIDESVRKTNKITLPTHRGIGATMVGVGMNVNNYMWKFDITHSNQTEYLIYDKTCHFESHVDTFLTSEFTEARKLTVLTFLNDDFKGGKLFLQVGNKKLYPPQNPGSMLVFPSFILHGVEPVTEGTRRTIVTWLVGPWFK